MENDTNADTVRDAAARRHRPARGRRRPGVANRALAHPSGNASALRKALELCVREMCKYCRAEAAMTMPGMECLYGCEALRIARAALAAPSRNFALLAALGEAAP